MGNTRCFSNDNKYLPNIMAICIPSYRKVVSARSAACSVDSLNRTCTFICLLLELPVTLLLQTLPSVTIETGASACFAVQEEDAVLGKVELRKGRIRGSLGK